MEVDSERDAEIESERDAEILVDCVIHAKWLYVNFVSPPHDWSVIELYRWESNWLGRWNQA